MPQSNGKTWCIFSACQPELWRNSATARLLAECFFCTDFELLRFDRYIAMASPDAPIPLPDTPISKLDVPNMDPMEEGDTHLNNYFFQVLNCYGLAVSFLFFGEVIFHDRPLAKPE